MSFLSLKGTIVNRTNYPLTLVSEKAVNLPQTIAANGQAEFNLSSGWSAIAGNVTYQIGDNTEHQAFMLWYVQAVGTNSYNTQVQPNDGRFSISRTGGSGYHPKVTFTLQ